MTVRPATSPSSPRAAVLLGVRLLWAASAVIAVSGWALTGGTQLVAVYAIAGVASGLAAGCLLLPVRLLSGSRLLLLPLIGLAELAGIGAATTGVGPAYSPLIAVAFVYVGLVCPPQASWLLLPAAAAAWLLANDINEHGIHPLLLIRLPISALVWLLVGELLSRRTAALRARTAELAGQIAVDPLTGLANRRALPGLLAAGRPGDCLLMLDLDQFRQVNAARGHVGGDRVLADFGASIRASLRGQDRAVRYGGEEILLLLPRGGDAGQPAAVDGMRSALHRLADTWQRLQPDVTFSAGGVVLTTELTAAAAVHQADRLLYQAKQAGRNRWQLSDPGT